MAPFAGALSHFFGRRVSGQGWPSESLVGKYQAGRVIAPSDSDGKSLARYP